MDDLAAMEADAARRGYHVRFERVTLCTLPVEDEPGCATLEEARQLLERVRKAGASGGLRNIVVVGPDGLLCGAIVQGGAVSGGFRLDETGTVMVPPDVHPPEPAGPVGPPRLSANQAAEARAALERINRLPREPSERLRALQADAEDEESA